MRLPASCCRAPDRGRQRAWCRHAGAKAAAVMTRGSTTVVRLRESFPLMRLPSPACGGRCPKSGWGRHRGDAPTTGATAVHGVALIRRCAPPSPASGRRDVWLSAMSVALRLTTYLLPFPACGRRCPKGGWGRHRCDSTTTGATAVNGGPHPALCATFSRQREKGCLAARDLPVALQLTTDRSLPPPAGEGALSLLP
ncbi:hypothetical protein FHR49_003520 [Xanthomonas campestris]